MKIVILAAGVGRRLWPVSNSNMPKQFQPLISEKPLIRMKFDYLLKGFSAKNIFISTDVKFVLHAKKIFPELPEENFIGIPGEKDNGPTALFSILKIKEMFPNEIVALQWSDHYIGNPTAFVNVLKQARDIVKKEEKVVMVGLPVKNIPTTKGHINIGSKILDLPNGNTLYEFVKHIEELPTGDTAKLYLESGSYLKNPGFIVTPMDIIIDKFKANAPDIYNAINQIKEAGFSKESFHYFEEMPRGNFSKVFTEKLNPNEALIIKSDVDWKDIGSWDSVFSTLQKASGESVKMGNVYELDSNNNLIFNYDSNKLVVLMSMNKEQFAIINTKEVLAIFPLKETGKLKELTNNFEIDKKYSKYL